MQGKDLIPGMKYMYQSQGVAATVTIRYSRFESKHTQCYLFDGRPRETYYLGAFNLRWVRKMTILEELKYGS